MADDKNKLNSKEIEELRKLIRLLQKEISDIDFKNLINSGGAAKTYLESLRKEAQELNNDLDDASFNFKKIVQEIKNSDEGFRAASKSFNKLSDIAEKVKYHQSGISKLSSDEIKNLQKQVAQEKQRLVDSSKFLDNKTSKLNSHLKSQEQEINKLINKNNKTKEEEAQLNKLLTDYEKITNELNNTTKIHNQIKSVINDEDKSLQALGKTLEEADKEAKDLEDKLASTKGLTSGINKIPFLSGVVDTNKMLDAAKEKIDANGTSTQALGAAFKNLGGQIKNNLLSPTAMAVNLGEQLVNALLSSDKATGDLAKQFDITYEKAGNVRQELTNIANSTGDAAVTTKGLQESMVAIGQTLGVNAQLNEKDLVTFTKLRDQAGYTNEELAGMQRLTLATGGNLENNMEAFTGTVAKMNAQNKLAINAKQLFKEVANVSEAIKLSVGGTAAKLAEAAFKAKQFGITLEQADKISESLLDFENSINNEISAELITGKELNFEKARLLALNGDIAGASAEILKQVGGTAEFSKMNRIQQEAIAKAAGMTKDELAKSLVDREAAEKLGAKEGQSAKDRYDELVKQYGVEKASQMLGNEALANQFQQQSIQERFTQSVEKLKEVFVSIAEPILNIVSPLMDLVSTVLPAINFLLQPLIVGFQTIAGWVSSFIEGLKEGSPLAIALAGAIGVMAYPLITSAIGAIYTTFSQIPLGLGIPLAIASVVGLFSMLSKGQSQAKAKDGVIDPKKGLVMSGGFGSVQLDPKDKAMYGADGKVKVGTNLIGPSMTTQTITPSPSPAMTTQTITPPPSPAIAAATATTTAANTVKQDNKDVINELKAIKAEQSKANSKPTIVENSMNGTKFGTAVAINTHKIQ